MGWCPISGKMIQSGGLVCIGWTYVYLIETLSIYTREELKDYKSLGVCGHGQNIMFYSDII